MEGFWTLEQWRRVFSTRGRHWRRVGSRAAIKKTGDRGDQQRFPPLFTFHAGGEESCHLQQKENAQTTMGFNRFLLLDLTILCLLSSS